MSASSPLAAPLLEWCPASRVLKRAISRASGVGGGSAYLRPDLRVDPLDQLRAERECALERCVLDRLGQVVGGVVAGRVPELVEACDRHRAQAPGAGGGSVAPGPGDVGTRAVARRPAAVRPLGDLAAQAEQPTVVAEREDQALASRVPNLSRPDLVDVDEERALAVELPAMAAQPSAHPERLRLL